MTNINNIKGEGKAMDKYLKCVTCEHTFSNLEICPKCKSDDLIELEEIKSKTNWNFVNSCFKE